MKIAVEIPGPLTDLSEGKSELLAEGRTLRELLCSLQTRFPALTARLFRNSGELNNTVNIFVNEVDFHRLSGLNTSVSGRDRVRVAIAPLISGGSQP